MLADISKLLPFFLHLSLIRYASPASCCKYSDATAVPGCIRAASTIGNALMICYALFASTVSQQDKGDLFYTPCVAMGKSCRLSHWYRYFVCLHAESMS